METTAFKIQSSSSPKGNLAVLVKALETFSMHTVHPGRISLFANTLEQKISQETGMGFPSESTANSPDGENFLPAAIKRVVFSGNGEPEGKGKVIMTADSHFLSSTCDNETSEIITGETESALALFQSVMTSFQREDPWLPIAGSAGKKPQTVIENAESTGEEETAIRLSTECMGQLAAISITGETALRADKPQPENAASSIVRLHESGTALSLQTVKPQDAAHLENKPDNSLTGKPSFIQAMDETPKLNKDGLTADTPLATNPKAAEAAEPSARNSGKGHFLADGNAVYLSLLKEAERMTEPLFTRTAIKTSELNNDEAVTDISSAGNPTVATAEESAATAASRESRPPLDLHIDYRSPMKGAERKNEPMFTQATDERPELNIDKAAANTLLSSNSIAATAEESAATAASRESRPPLDLHIDYRSPMKGAERKNEPMFTQATDERPELNIDKAAANTLLSSNSIAATAEESAATAASRESRPPLDLHIDYRSPMKGAERKNEPMFTQATDERPELNIDKAAANTLLSSNSIAATAEESAATAASRESRPPLDLHIDYRSPMKGAERKNEPMFTQATDDTQKIQQDGLKTDATLSDISQNIPSHRVQLNQTEKSQKKTWMSGMPIEPISAANDGNATIGQASSELLVPRESQEKTLRIRNITIESPVTTGNQQKSRNAVSNHRSIISGSDILPFRVEMPNIVPAQEITASSTVEAKEIGIQTVINQILEARQNARNDLGRVRIQLDPPNLGTVDLDIVVRGERVDVVMTAENATVQRALQSRADDIRIAMQRQDLRIEGFQVVLQDNGTSQQQTDSGAMYRQSREQWERFNATEDIPSVVPTFSYTAGGKSVTGRVSIFV